MRNKKALLLTGTLALLFPSAIGTFALIKYANSSKINPNQIEDKTPSFSDKEKEPTTSNENSTPSNVDNSPKELSKEEKELELAPNLIPFVKKYNKEHSDAPISDIKQLVDIINTLNTNDNEEDNINTESWTDFEKQYLNLYNSINNFFKEELKYRYKLANFSFEVLENAENDKIFATIKTEQDIINEKQKLYNTLFQGYKDYIHSVFFGTTNSEFENLPPITNYISDIINEKIKNFDDTILDFNFIVNPTFKYNIFTTEGGLDRWLTFLLQITLELTYKTDKLPEILKLPLILEIDNKTTMTYSVLTEEQRNFNISEFKRENPSETWSVRKFATYEELKAYLESKNNNYASQELNKIRNQLRNTLLIFDINDFDSSNNDYAIKYSSNSEEEPRDIY